MVLSAFSFSLMSLCVKQLGGRIPVAEVVFIRALISLVLSWWVIQRQGVSPWGNRHPMLIWRGVVGTLALFCFYGAISQLPLAAATVLQYLYPTFTAALAWGALGERAGKRILLAMALGWLGVLLVAQPDWLAQLTGDRAMDPLPALAVAIGITGALLTALAYVTVRRLATDEHHKQQMTNHLHGPTINNRELSSCPWRRTQQGPLCWRGMEGPAIYLQAVGQDPTQNAA